MVRLLSDTANSGIYVSEGLSSSQPIAVRRETVVAFLGAAARGPVGIPVTVTSTEEYLNRFGAPNCENPLYETVQQFFSNGGSQAIIIRVCSSARRHRIVLPGPAGSLTLEALNPGPHEILRAAVDYDGVAATEPERFNLVIHRLSSRLHPVVEEQEIYSRVTVDISDSEYVGHALLNSELVSIKGAIPAQRPDVSFHNGVEVGASYIYVDPEWPDTESLTDYDLVGCNTEGTGLFALDRLASVDLVCIVSDEGSLGPVALFTAERYCRKRNAVLCIDPPAHWHTVEDALRFSRESGFASPNVMTYFPRPADVAGRPGSAIGAITGAMVAVDAKKGIWGGTDREPLTLRGRLRLPLSLDADEKNLLRRSGINALQPLGSSHADFTGFVTFNRGNGCLPEFDSLCYRRALLFIVESIVRGTRWAAFQRNEADTRAELRGQVSTFLQTLHELGALTGSRTRDAFYVQCDFDTNSAAHEGNDRGISFVAGFAVSNHPIQVYRFTQRRVECEIQLQRTELQIDLAV